MAGVSVLLLVVLCACCADLGHSQDLQCSSLNVDNQDNAQPGSDLDICTTTSPQCCTQNYLNLIKREARSRLLGGLREELSDRSRDFNQTVQRVVNYFTTTFPQVFANHIPNIESFGDTLAGQITQLIRDELAPVFSGTLSTFDGTAFVNDVLSQFDSAAIGFLSDFAGGSLDENKQMCIRRFIDGIINADLRMKVANSLDEVYKSVQAINRIANFLVTYDNRIATTYDLSEACVRRLVELSFCGRCTGRIPPLCDGTCGALVRGCFAPFVTGLERSFNSLWNVSVQIVRNINMTVTEILMSEDLLLDGRSIIQLGLDIARDCDLTLTLPPLGRKKRQNIDEDELLPSRVMEEVMGLRGVFRYDDDGPEFCEPSDDDDEESCRNRDNSNDRDCDSESVCTSSCQCWNGSSVLPENMVTFNIDGIEGQDKNPVFTQNLEDLEKKAQALGDPVFDFLTSDEFVEVIPAGVTVPPAAPYSGGAKMTAVYSLGLLLVAIVCLLFAL